MGVDADLLNKQSENMSHRDSNVQTGMSFLSNDRRV